MSQTYPVGTHVVHVVQYDRTTKVAFGCKEHPGPVYMSKDPNCSAWFPGNEQARKIQDGFEPDPCNHTSSDRGVWVITTEYTGLA